MSLYTRNYKYTTNINLRTSILLFTAIIKRQLISTFDI